MLDYSRKGEKKMHDLEIWLRKNNMTTNSFAVLVNCSRQVIWKVKKNIPIDSKIAKRIQEVTNFLVSPQVQPVGNHRL